MPELSVIPYSSVYQSDFERLNIAWISELFVVEAHDLDQLKHPEVYILPNDGAIFLAKYGDEIVGTVALVNAGDAGFELAKMCVAPYAQGLGIGKKLCLAAIDYARQLGLPSIWLESNRRATAALSLYHSVGFSEVPLLPSPYTRADIRMELTL